MAEVHGTHDFSPYLAGYRLLFVCLLLEGLLAWITFFTSSPTLFYDACSNVFPETSERYAPPKEVRSLSFCIPVYHSLQIMYTRTNMLDSSPTLFLGPTILKILSPLLPNHRIFLSKHNFHLHFPLPSPPFPSILFSQKYFKFLTNPGYDSQAPQPDPSTDFRHNLASSFAPLAFSVMHI